MSARRLRWVAAVGVITLVAAACQPGPTQQPTTTPGGETPTTQQPDPGAEGFPYTLGIFSDTTTNNYWAYLDPNSTVWNAYVLAPTKAGLYTILFPGLEIGPDLAAEEFAPAVQEGDQWVAEVAIREDAAWSDGEPVRAQDMVFTFEAVRDLQLGGNWLAVYPVASDEDPDRLGIVEIEAVDDKTVRIVFNRQPGLAIWPHAVGTAPLMPEHFWADAVEEARGSDDPAATLYAADGSGDPSTGPVVFQSREPGASATNTANDSYFRKGEEVTSGGVTYQLGPFLGEELFSLYGSQDAAVLALRNGEVDYLLNPLGMQRGLQDQVVNDASLEAVVNATNGFRYLAFNMRREPMSIPEFRQALALMINKEFMANQVLQGVAFPLYTLVPEGNEAFYAGDVAEEIAGQFSGLSEEERITQAVELLSGAGFTWDSEPGYDAENGSVIHGEGMRLPNGQPVPQLEVLAPGPSYDPLRATYSVWIEQWLTQLGVPARANPTDFNTLVQAVFVPNDAGELDYDMFLLGWSLTVFPDFFEAFFHSRNDTLVNDGNNNTGYASDEFDALADELLSATTEEEARSVVADLERQIAEDLPYVVLFDTGILEFYRAENVEFPFTETLSGLQFLSGMPGTVTSR